MKTFLDVVKDCDNFPYPDPGNSHAYEEQLSTLWTFHLPDDIRPHGFLLDWVVQSMPWTEDFQLNSSQRQVHLLRRRDAANWQELCSQSIDQVLDLAREQNIFPSLGQKRDERFSVIGAKFPVSIERSAISLFGIVGCGVHLTVYTRAPPTESEPEPRIKLWIPQRNFNKSTYPGMLDNTVAGGVAEGEIPFDCLVREASEEAALSESLIRTKARSAGTVTWFNISDERAGGIPGLMNPGLLYVYDMEVGSDVVFTPVDDDIHEFHLMDVNQAKQAMLDGRFKPASANVLLDFLIRHDLITADEEEDYAEIVSRLHRKLPF
ncbi:hypothetical protein ASPZODRAFT_15458 [Penicilliopsis zonata CBS 506.65]|uniref:Nudix hydrolase domain-containing protein n=1 Tax=Penicilliopsis zonata CBS 506.65 TaxID=1073090 RepID=A0A1L9SLP4_9EURO|nr:hypothetical protein ASPZODRAFT_15458 [Penicilliopsis zonata CBS 506.65]OJJ48011.1 hypothetical protein ASPZODRAFT_15458 [Penicilliopsis zonata CBS 506.65]